MEKVEDVVEGTVLRSLWGEKAEWGEAGDGEEGIQQVEMGLGAWRTPAVDKGAFLPCEGRGVNSPSLGCQAKTPAAQGPHAGHGLPQPAEGPN